jgi:hypothetical protein
MVPASSYALNHHLLSSHTKHPQSGCQQQHHLSELCQQSLPVARLLFFFLQSEHAGLELIHVLHCWLSPIVMGMV